MVSNPSGPLNILLTGTSGFIGARVADKLLSEGHRVVGIDNQNHAYDVRLKEWRLAQLQERQNFIFQPLDITDGDSLRNFIESPTFKSSQPFNAIINLAARAGVRQSMATPAVFYETNVMGTLNLLELCREQGIEKFVLSSTSSVYGAADNQIDPSLSEGSKTYKQLHENLPTDRPISPYAASKMAAEGLCYTYHHLYELDVTVFRFFTVFGPAGRPDMSIFRFIRWIEEGDPVVVYGDGTQSRDFTYVGDVARGVVAGLKPLGFETINLGSDHPVPLNTVISLLEEIMHKRANIDYQPTHPADIRATWADVSTAKKVLDWTPEVSFEEGLAQSVKWYRDNRGWAQAVNL